MIIGIEEAGDDVLRRVARLSMAERHEHHLVAVQRSSIPASVFAYERTAAEVRGKFGAVVHRHAQGCHVGGERVIRHDRLGHEVRPLRLHTRVQMLAKIAIGPAIEASVLYRGQIVRHQIGPDLIAFVDDGPKLVGLRLPCKAGGIARPAGEDAMRA